MPHFPECPECRSDRVVPVVYGYPGQEMLDAANRGEVALGGCLLRRFPEWHCRACGHTWPHRGYGHPSGPFRLHPDDLVVPVYLRPVWGAWTRDDDGLWEYLTEFLDEAERHPSLAAFWAACARADLLLWTYQRAVRSGVIREQAESALCSFACWALRQTLGLMRERSGNTAALEQLWPTVYAMETSLQSDGGPSVTVGVLPEAKVYFRRSECHLAPDPDGRSFAYWACHSLAESSPLEAARKASYFAAWFRGYIAVHNVTHGRSLSLEEYGNRTHPTAWYPAAEAELAVQADKLRELIGNPFLVT